MYLSLFGTISKIFCISGLHSIAELTEQKVRPIIRPGYENYFFMGVKSRKPMRNFTVYLFLSGEWANRELTFKLKREVPSVWTLIPTVTGVYRHNNKAYNVHVIRDTHTRSRGHVLLTNRSFSPSRTFGIWNTYFTQLHTQWQALFKISVVTWKRGSLG